MTLNADQKLSAISAIISDASAAAGPAPITFHRPTAEELAAFCADFKLDPRQITPWTQTPRGETTKATDGTNLVSFPTLPATTDQAVAIRYAGCAGYRATGERGLSTETDFEQARTMADRQIAAPDAAARENIMAGSGAPETSAVVYGLMSATGAQFKTFGSPTFGGGLTIADLIVTAFKSTSRKPGDPGASGL